MHYLKVNCGFSYLFFVNLYVEFLLEKTGNKPGVIEY